ncbi:MAG: alpha/beta fold hydrolase [Bryobacteraceae bacterium]
MTNTLLFEGCPISYDLNGRGEPVVFVQGVGVHGSGWGYQVRELARDYRCLTFDNRGIGSSCPASANITVEQLARDTLAIMDAAGFAQAHLVGHSFGGLIAQQLALTARSRVRTLSLLCTTGRGADTARLSPVLLWRSLRSRIGTRAMRRSAFLRIVMPERYLAGLDRDKLGQEVAALFGHDLADSPAIVRRQLIALCRFNPGSRLKELSGIPTLVVSAREDPIFPPRFGRALAEAIGEANFIEIPNASHGVIIQRAEEMNTLLREHFAIAADR